MPPQFTQEQRNFLMLEYHKRRGKKNFVPGMFDDFNVLFPEVRRPVKSTLRKLLEKQKLKGTILNCNKVSSPGESHSGHRRSVNTPENQEAVKNVMDRDCAKQLGDATVSPVSTARRNVLAMGHSFWARIKKEIRYHPYKPIRRHKLLGRF